MARSARSSSRSRADPVPGAPPARDRPDDEGGDSTGADPSGAAPVRPAPLLLVCALGVERAALRGAGRAGAAGPVTLLRTGMGPRAATRAVSDALRGDPALRAAAVLVTGFCAGLAPGMKPGDVVVDDRSHDAGRLADAITRRAARPAAVHTGRVAGSDHVVRGAERSALGATGAVAVDMESAAVRDTVLAAGPRPVAVVRVVVDTAEHELVRIATLRNGILAFRMLRSLLPAFHDWHRSTELPWR